MVWDTATDFYVAVLYVLLTKKTKTAYDLVMKEILLACGPIDIAYLHCDFETALITSAREHFPHSKIIGCLFHLKQAWLRKMKNLAIPSLQRKRALSVGMVDLLSIIPIDEIETFGIPYLQSLLDFQQ